MHGRDRFAGGSPDGAGAVKLGVARAQVERPGAAAAQAAVAGSREPAALWSDARALLLERFGAANYARWIGSLSVRASERGLALELSDRTRSLAIRRHFLPGIEQVLRDLGFAGEVVLRDAASPQAAPEAVGAGPTAPLAPEVQSPAIACGERSGESGDAFPAARSRYRFATFVVGESNRFAFEAARRVAENPGRVHNPLYLHGGVGLGKTHLGTAIAHAVHGAGAHAVVVSADRFLARGEAARDAAVDELDQALAHARAVLFDDVQLLLRDERVLDELFRRLDELLAAGCQLVLTCDLPPPEIPSLAVRLKSRWESGFAAEIRAPDLAVRREIVRRQAYAARTELSDEIVELIASTEESSVRALEGAFNRVRALASEASHDLSLALVREALRRSGVDRPVEPPSLDAIVESVAAAFELGARDLRSRRRRDRTTSLARHVAVYVARRVSAAPLIEIAADLGFRDHSAAAHACAALRDRLARDPQLSARVAGIERRLVAGGAARRAPAGAQPPSV